MYALPLAAALLVSTFTAAIAADIDADIVIRGATIHDGTAAAGRVGDIAIKGDRIVAVGSFTVASQTRVIDGKGLIAAPGFIDLHNHSDRSITKKPTREIVNYLTQGCTTIVTGNCGGGRADVAAYLKEIERGGAGANVAHLIPQGQLRKEVMGSESRPPSPAELAAMRKRVEREMEAGAFGMSTGLIYVPGSFATTEELVALASVVSKHGGIYASHMRNENTRVLEAIEEALTIGRRAKLPVHISHFKTMGRAAWGLAPDAIRSIQAARDDGMTVTADQYPYIASSTSLAAMVIPRKYRTGNRFTEALADAEELKQLKEQMKKSIAARNGGESLYIASYQKNRKWQGMNLLQIAMREKRDPLDIAIEIQTNGGAQMVSFGMREEDVRLIMREPFVATASDGSAKVLTAETVPHPRNYGTFPRKIGFYSVEVGVLSLSQAIRSSSGLPADILKLTDRGYLRQGAFADIVVFDRDAFRDRATFQKPHQYSGGVKYLLVNGVVTIDDGKYERKLAGRALRRPRAPKDSP
ncbi:MAG: D-aminoacylase [Pirellulaceae bacterium]|nr:D-aminoacylase [Pirellulaceae bacterium]